MRMIDRQAPERSLLLQYAMPGSIAEYDHPDVPNYRPVLRGPTDVRYRQILSWIGHSLQPVEPKYGIDFKTPGATTNPAATQTATAPAPSGPAPAETATRPATPSPVRARQTPTPVRRPTAPAPPAPMR
jgi:hypothetical protein